MVGMHGKKLYGTATVGTKGQVVIPADAREDFGIEPGDRLYVVGSQAHGWVGLLKEDELRGLIDRITDDVEEYKNLLQETKE